MKIEKKNWSDSLPSYSVLLESLTITYSVINRTSRCKQTVAGKKNAFREKEKETGTHA